MRLLKDGPRSVTALLVLNPLMARMVEAAGFGADGSQPECGGLEEKMLATIDIETRLAVERATIETGKD
jgi:hypothetical protein